MPTRETPAQERLLYTIIGQYRANFNSSAMTAEVFGVSVRTMQRWLRHIKLAEDEGLPVAMRSPIKSERRARQLLETVKSSTPFIVDEGKIAELVAKRTTQNFVMYYYDLQRGMTIPEEVRKKAIGYQIILEDQYGRKITTVVGTPKAVFSDARKKMARYSQFHAKKVTLSVRTRR